MTLFQLMTLDGCTEVMYFAESGLYQDWLIKGYFVSFVIFTAIISFNIFVAVLTSQVHEKMLAETIQGAKNKPQEMKTDGNNNALYTQHQMDLIMAELKALREEVAKLKK